MNARGDSAKLDRRFRGSYHEASWFWGFLKLSSVDSWSAELISFSLIGFYSSKFFKNLDVAVSNPQTLYFTNNRILPLYYPKRILAVSELYCLYFEQ